MKFKNISNEYTNEANMTSLQGYIDSTYQQLVRLFGEPNDGDDYKVQKEWVLKFEDGTIATIYDYKMGDCYNGSGEGVHYSDVTDWHIGGHNETALNHVLGIIAEDNKKLHFDDVIEGEVITKSLPHIHSGAK